jgi:hypothetical protein
MNINISFTTNTRDLGHCPMSLGCIRILNSPTGARRLPKAHMPVVGGRAPPFQDFNMHISHCVQYRTLNNV